MESTAPLPERRPEQRRVADKNPPGTYTVRGRVEDSDGEPVETFTITHSQETNLRMGPEVEFSDAEGSFALHGLRAGELRLMAKAPGYLFPALTIATVPREEVIVLVVQNPGRITGVVRDPFGAPHSGARVDFREAHTTSDPDGSFTLQLEKHAKEGQLFAAAEGFAPSLPRTVLVPPDQTVEVELELGTEAMLRGVVLDANGDPEAGAEVQLGSFETPYQKALDGSLECVTDEGGRFEYRGLPPGTYMVAVDETDRPSNNARAFRLEQVTLAAGDVVEVTLGGREETAIELTLLAFDGDLPAAEAKAYVFPAGGDFLGRAKEFTLDANGRGLVALAEAGDYAVRVERKGVSASKHLTRMVRVPDEPTFTVEVRFPRRASLAGRVIGAEAGIHSSTNRRVYLARDDAFDPTTLGEGIQTSPGDQGEFLFEDVSPGLYTLGLQGAQPLAGIRIGPGDRLSGFELRIEELAAVTGQVLLADGQPAAEAEVFARTAGGAWAKRWGERCDERGNFHFADLGPGAHSFVARYRDLASAESAPLALASGELANLELRLGPGALVRLALKDAKGEPSPATHFVVRDSKGRSCHEPRSAYDLELFLQEGFAVGSRLVGPLAPGEYEVEIHAPDGHVASKRVTLEAGWNDVALER